MSDNQFDQQPVNPEQPVASHRRRSARYANPELNQAQPAPASETETPEVNKPFVASMGIPAGPHETTRAYPPAPRDESVSQGPTVRYPVAAPGYSQGKPVDASYVRTSARQASDRPFTHATPPRPAALERPVPVQPDVDDEQPACGHAGRIVLIAAVILVLLIGGFLAAMLMIPTEKMPGFLQAPQQLVYDLAGKTAGNGGDEVFPVISDAPVTEQPTALPAAASPRVSVETENLHTAVGGTPTFRVTTDKQVTAVRVIDSLGNELARAENPSVTNEDNNQWVLTCSFSYAFSGVANVQIFDGSRWMNTDYSAILEVYEAKDAPAETEPVLTDEPAEEPTDTPTPVPSDTPVPVLRRLVMGMTSTNLETTTANQPTFNMTTAPEVLSVRIVDNDGIVLANESEPFVENGENKIWVLTCSFTDSFEGTVTVEVYDGVDWIDTGITENLKITASKPVQVDNGFTARGVEGTEEENTPVPEQTDDDPQPVARGADVSDEDGEPEDFDDLEDGDDPEDFDDSEDFDEPGDYDDSEDYGDPEDADAPDDAEAGEDFAGDDTGDEYTAPEDMLTPYVPGETPAPETTAESAPAVTPAPTMQPVLVAAPAENAIPAKVIKEAVVFDNTKKIRGYVRPSDNIVRMHGAREYTAMPNGKEFGIFTFRGNAFRTNAAIGTVGEDTSRLSVKWTYKANSVKGAGNKVYYGIGWTGQPVIIKWSKEIREHTNIVDEKRDTKALKEVIVAGADGRIYYLDLTDGQPTRPEVNVGYPLYGTPSLHSMGYPLMTVGQYARKMAKGNGSIGLRYYNLLNQEQIYMQDGLDSKNKRTVNSVGSFNTSALVDRSTDTLVTAGTNGLLYVTKLNTEFDYSMGSININPVSVVMRSKANNQKNDQTAVESSMAMYGSYAYFADLAGYLHCVDTTTMENVWVVRLGDKAADKVEAAVSLDFDENGTLWVYVANEYSLRGKNGGPITIASYNAQTGELGWSMNINVKKAENKKTKTAIVAGVRASAVIGENDIDDLVIYTVSSLGKAPGITVAGSENGTADGCVVALHKKDGSVAWTRALDSYAYASPVAVYSESGRSWIIQPAASGTIYLLEGTTGEVVSTLQVEGTIEASPAVYGDTMVIGTTGKDKSFIYGITIE